MGEWYYLKRGEGVGGLCQWAVGDGVGKGVGGLCQWAVGDGVGLGWICIWFWIKRVGWVLIITRSVWFVEIFTQGPKL